VASTLQKLIDVKRGAKPTHAHVKCSFDEMV